MTQDSAHPDMNDHGDLPEESFLRRNWLPVSAGVALLAAGTWAAFLALNSRNDVPLKKADLVITRIIDDVRKDETKTQPEPKKTVEEPAVKEVVEETPAPAETRQEPVSTNIKGPGGILPLGPGGKGGNAQIQRQSPTAAWSPYARAAASGIAESMRRHGKLKNASMDVVVRLWIDATGRVTRVVADSTGDPVLDTALREDVLKDRQLSGPPPQGMRMPVSLKVSARHP